MINRFREALYQIFPRRADTTLDLIDGLTSELHTESPVAVSESPLFRRKFSSVYDTLNEEVLDEPQLRGVLDEFQPPDAEQIAGYEVYSLDCTADPAPDAPTLADLSQSKKGKYAPTTVEHRYSWLVRLVGERTSWCMPQDMRRVETTTTDSQVGAAQVDALAERNQRPKVVVADSLYCNSIFLAVFVWLESVYALVRMRSSMVLREEPPERKPGQKGRPRKHGEKFKLSDPQRAPDRVEESSILGQAVVLKAWEGLHLYKLPLLMGMVILVQFLKSDGTPRFKRPMFLFWTGPTTVSLVDLVRMYLWRFAIEHMFRFLKQDMGLTKANSPNLVFRHQWVWCCALAYCQLLLMRQAVADRRPPWHPRMVRGRMRVMSPRQVRRQALGFLLTLGTPARSTQPAGKGHGRPFGYQPKARKQHPVVKKAKKAKKSSKTG